MSYIRESFISTDKKIMIVKKHHNIFFMPTKEKIKQRRLPKTNETKLKQEKINERLRRENICGCWQTISVPEIFTAR